MNSDNECIVTSLYSRTKEGTLNKARLRKRNRIHTTNNNRIGSTTIMLRDACRFQRDAQICLKFTSGRIGIATAQAPLLAQSVCGVLVGQSLCKPQACARESIDSTRSSSEQLHTCRDRRQFAFNCYVTLLQDPIGVEVTNEDVDGENKCHQ